MKKESGRNRRVVKDVNNGRHLEVAVHDAARVAVGERAEQLREEAPRGRLFETPVARDVVWKKRYRVSCETSYTKDKSKGIISKRF